MEEERFMICFQKTVRQTQIWKWVSLDILMWNHQRKLWTVVVMQTMLLMRNTLAFVWQTIALESQLRKDKSKIGTKLFGIVNNITITTSFGMSMASSENTRDQWNNPLVSGSATSHAAFSGYQYFALHAAKIVINFNIATKLQHFLRLFVIKCIATEFYT